MDFGSIINTITNSDSISQISNLTGSSSSDVSNVLSSALPQLLNGAQGQATGKDTATSFANALSAHAKDDVSDVSSFFGHVDMDDGEKIVGHLLGGNASSTADEIAKQNGMKSADISKILAAAAPFLMSLLGKQAVSSQSDSSSGLAGIVGSLFSGGGDDKDGGGIGGLLSGLFK